MSTHAPTPAALLSAPPADEIFLDLKGLNCPLPVLRLAKAMRGAREGARFKVVATDPMSKLDIPHFCQTQGHVLVGTGETDGVFHFVIEAGADPARDG
jgi:tRNA 2-thiouridine synthesizing protein A